MLIITFFLILLIASLLICRYADWRSPLDSLAGPLLLMGAIGLLLCLLTIPLHRMAVNAELAEIEGLRVTQASGRLDKRDLEGIAWRTQIAKANRSIKRHQYYNSTVFDIWVPDAVDSVSLLR